MAEKDFLGNNPLLRLAIPLIAGIAIASICDAELIQWALLLVFSLAVCGISLFFERLALLFGAASMVAMFSAGALVQRMDDVAMAPQWEETKGDFSALFVETPRMGDRTTKALVRLRREDADSLPGRREGLAYIYFANCTDAENLRIGERVRFTAKVRNPKNAGNPAEFDYAHFLYVKGVTATLYLPVGSWEKEGSEELSLRMRALALRERVVELYDRAGFDGDTKAVLSALTVGDKSELSGEVKDTFSSVGASHILALSGLHLGIFYVIFSCLLPAVRSRRRYMVARELVIVGALWLFAFVAGLSPSIVRAAVLFTLLSVARCARRDSFSVNALSLAAIAMLLFSPRSLFDVSFQLSFSAVLSILLLFPMVRKLLDADSHGRIYRYFADMLALSVAAQIGTLPVLWYCFGSFPTYFLVTNIVVVPLAFVIMSLAVLLWLVSPFAVLCNVVAWLLNAAVGTLGGWVKLVESLPASTLQLPYIDSSIAWMLALTLLLLYLSAVRRRVELLAMAFTVAVVTFAWGLLLRGEGPRETMFFFNSSSYPALLLTVSRDSSYLVSTEKESEADTEHILAPYLRCESMDAPLWVDGEYCDKKLVYKGGVLEFCGRRIRVLSDKSWMDEEQGSPVDLLFLCKGFKGSMESLLALYPARYVVMDAGLHYMTRRRVERECAVLGVCCIDISEAGAVEFKCGGDSFSPLFVRE